METSLPEGEIKVGREETTFIVKKTTTLGWKPGAWRIVVGGDPISSGLRSMGGTKTIEVQEGGSVNVVVIAATVWFSDD